MTLLAHFNKCMINTIGIVFTLGDTIARFVDLLYIEIILMHPKTIILGLCLLTVYSATAEKDSEWWKHTIVYQIYPRSFQDSNGDGVGDLQGIISRLDYFDYLGVETLWLSPIYKSPFADFGYDISDFRDIDPIFGTMDDFDQLLKKMHAKGMKLVMDFIPNHSSDMHPWFIESQKGGNDNEFADYYRWSDGKVLDDGKRVPPNNWMSFFGGSAWEWSDQRQQYYLHQFVKGQPDLDYRNPKVRQQMQDALQFWAEKGVDGFRIDAINTLFEPEDVYQDEPRSMVEGVSEAEHAYLDHTLTLHQPEIHTVIREWRNMLDQYQQRTGKSVFMVMEVYDESYVESMKYYDSGADMPFNFDLIFINDTCGGACVQRMVDSWMAKMPDGKWPNFVLGNHDNKRITTRKGGAFTDVLNIMLLLLPGTPTTYYGEEIGQLDIEVTYEDTQDPAGRNAGPDLYYKYSRDPCRAPMQWDDSTNAGFSTAEKTWLPVHPDYITHNVKVEKKDESGLSSIQIYREAAKLRQRPAFRNGNIDYHVTTNSIFSFVRKHVNDIYLVILNLSDSIVTADYTINVDNQVYERGTVAITTTGEFVKGSTVDLKYLTLKQAQGVVLQLIGGSKDEL